MEVTEKKQTGNSEGKPTVEPLEQGAGVGGMNDPECTLPMGAGVGGAEPKDPPEGKRIS